MHRNRKNDLPGAEGRNEELFSGYRVSVFQDENILEMCFTAK